MAANTLNIANFSSINITARTTLAADVASGSSSLSVENSGDFTGGQVYVGAPNGDTSELVTATTPASASAIPLSTPLTKAHNFNEPVLMLFGDSIIIYTAADIYGNGTQPPDANFAQLSGGTISIDGNKSYTSFTDSVSPAGTWYKYVYYNSVSHQSTALASSRAVQSNQVHYVSLDQVKDAAGFRNNTNVTDDIVAEKRDAAEKEVNGALQGVYDLPLPQPANPIIVEIVRNIAGGNLMAEMYTGVSAEKVAEGEAKAAKGRVGSAEDSTAGLAQLVDRSVVLLDANYIEETRDEAHGFGGWPDETTQDTTGAFSNEQLGQNGMDRGFEFYMNRRY